MELIVNKRECYYEVSGKKIYVGIVFPSAHDDGKWFADSYDGSFSADYFTSKPFKTKQDAVRHIDETMKDIFKRILDENT
jgi:hypothetical protein